MTSHGAWTVHACFAPVSLAAQCFVLVCLFMHVWVIKTHESLGVCWAVLCGDLAWCIHCTHLLCTLYSLATQCLLIRVSVAAIRLGMCLWVGGVGAGGGGVRGGGNVAWCDDSTHLLCTFCWPLNVFFSVCVLHRLVTLTAGHAHVGPSGACVFLVVGVPGGGALELQVARHHGDAHGASRVHASTVPVSFAA